METSPPSGKTLRQGRVSDKGVWATHHGEIPDKLAHDQTLSPRSARRRGGLALPVEPSSRSTPPQFARPRPAVDEQQAQRAPKSTRFFGNFQDIIGTNRGHVS